MALLELAGRIAVVTGAANGIGRALALSLARAGMDLVLADIDEDGLAQTAAAATAAGARVLHRRLDAGDFADNLALADAAFGWSDAPVALVFANAGVHGLTGGIDPDLDVWDRAIRVNLRGPVCLSKAFLTRLIAQGTPSQFVVTASQGAVVAAPGMAPYIATKHAEWGFADSLRVELAQARSPVGVSLIAPGRTMSGMTLGQRDRLLSERGQTAADAYEAQLVTTERVADVVVREVVKRPFWIVPSREDVTGVLQKRVDAFVAGAADGRIEG